MSHEQKPELIFGLQFFWKDGAYEAIMRAPNIQTMKVINDAFSDFLDALPPGATVGPDITINPPT